MTTQTRKRITPIIVIAAFLLFILLAVSACGNSSSYSGSSPSGGYNTGSSSWGNNNSSQNVGPLSPPSNGVYGSDPCSFATDPGTESNCRIEQSGDPNSPWGSSSDPYSNGYSTSDTPDSNP